MSTLRVYFGQEACGLLTENEGGALEFRYLDEWIEAGRQAISIRFPVVDTVFTTERVEPFVSSFLPEGESLRRRLEKQIHVDADYEFGLLRALGRESAGALSFWPEDEEPFAEPFGYDALSDEEFETWKAWAHQTPLQFPGRTLRLSLAGAQSKTALYFDENDDAFIPTQGAPTTHILKPRINGCRPSSVFIEWLTMNLARAVLGDEQVPAATLWRNCYRVRRFDRPGAGHGISRLHQEDFCVALGRMPTQKYESSSPRERLLAPCFELIDELGRKSRLRSPAIERLRLLDQVIVNVLLHNPDAHLKNYALLYDPDGFLSVSPLYDCLCTFGMTFESTDDSGWARSTAPAIHTRNLSLRIGNAEQIDEVTVDDWEFFAEECGFTKALIRRRLRNLSERVGDQLQDVLDALVEAVPAAEGSAHTVARGARKQLESFRV